MSVKSMTWAFEQPISGNDKVVLLALADHADDDGYCWPSIGRLVKKSFTSESSVKRSLKALQLDGFIEIERREHESGRSTSNGYRLLLGEGVKMNPSTQSEREEGVKDERGEGFTAEPPYEPSEGNIRKNQQEKEKENTKEKESRPFDEFWAAYPRRSGDSIKKAEEKYRAAIKKGATHEQIVAGAKAYAKTRKGADPVYTAMAKTWLHQECWKADYGPEVGPKQIDEFCNIYPSKNIGSRDLVVHYYTSAVQSASHTAIMDGLKKYCVLVKQKKGEGYPMQVPAAAVWLQHQRWREMDNYDIGFRGMGEKYLRAKRGEPNV